MSYRSTPFAVLLLSLLVPAAGLPQVSANRTEALQKRLQGRPDATALAAGREAIAEARRSGDQAALRDALVLVASAAMRVESFEAGMRVLREEAWPSGLAAAATLHLVTATALLEQTRRPDAQQGVWDMPDLRRVANELDRNAPPPTSHGSPRPSATSTPPGRLVRSCPSAPGTPSAGSCT